MAEGGGRGVRDGLSTVTFGTLALVVATLCLILFNFLARILIVRSISVEQYNAFALGFALAQVLIAVGAFGIPTAVARNLPYATSDAERRAVVRTSLWAGGIAAVSAGAALTALAPTIAHDLAAPDLALGLAFFGVAVACLIVANLLASIFQGFADVLPNALFVQVLNPALFLVFLSVALVVPPGRISYLDALLGYVVANLVTLAALVVYSTRRLPRLLPHGPVDAHGRSRLLAILAPLAVLGAMTSVAGSGDTLVLGADHYAQVGLYSVSLTLARLVQVGIGAASYIFLPVASRLLSRKDTRAVGLTYATVTKWLTTFSLPLFVVFFFLPSRSLEFVYGPSYDSVVLPLQVVVLGAFAGTLLGPGVMTQVAVGANRLVAVNATVAGAADVVLALALVPAYGASGAAAAWSIANVLFAGLCVSELAVLEGLHPFRRDFLAPLAAVLVPVGLVLSVVRPTLPLLALPPLALGIAGLFVIAVIVTRSVGEGDRLLLEAVEAWSGRRVPGARWVGRWLRRPDVRGPVPPRTASAVPEARSLERPREDPPS